MCRMTRRKKGKRRIEIVHRCILKGWGSSGSFRRKTKSRIRVPNRSQMSSSSSHPSPHATTLGEPWAGLRRPPHADTTEASGWEGRRPVFAGMTVAATRKTPYPVFVGPRDCWQSFSRTIRTRSLRKGEADEREAGGQLLLLLNRIEVVISLHDSPIHGYHRKTDPVGVDWVCSCERLLCPGEGKTVRLATKLLFVRRQLQSRLPLYAMHGTILSSQSHFPRNHLTHRYRDDRYILSKLNDVRF